MFDRKTGAPRAGSELRAARERLGWALPDVAAMLRIRLSYLEALEAGRTDRLPANVYALGYLRGYALALGLDAEEVMRRFKAEAADVTTHTELTFPAPMRERGLPAGAFILLGLILMGGVYTWWYRMSGEGKLPAEAVAPVPAHLATLMQQAVPGPDGKILVPTAPPEPPPPAPRVEDSNTFEPRQAASERKVVLPPPPPPPPPAKEAAEAVPVQSGTPTTAIAMPVIRHSEPSEPAPSVAQSEAPAPEGPRVLLRFTGDTWVQVKERGGQTLVNKVMKAGDTFTIPDRPNLILSTGNAGRMEILVDGVAIAPLGGLGAVRKDVALDPEQLRAGPVVPVSSGR